MFGGAAQTRGEDWIAKARKVIARTQRREFRIKGLVPIVRQIRLVRLNRYQLHCTMRQHADYGSQ